MAVNWGLLQQPDIAGSFQQGLAQGRQMLQQRQQQNALAALSSDPNNQQAMNALLAIDPTQALGFAKFAEYQRGVADDRAKRAALSSVLSSRDSGQSNPGGGMNRQALADYAAAGGDPTNLIEVVGKLDKAKQEQLGTQQEAFARLGQYLRGIPYEQRRAQLQQAAPQLQQFGISPEQIAGFDPTDETLDRTTAMALKVTETLAQLNKDRDYALDEQQFGEAQRHNRASEEVSRAASARAAEARAEGRTRFKERNLDRAALAASGGIRTDISDLDY